MPPASVLSPLAAPFVPTSQEYNYESFSFSSVYTDGMPSLLFVGDHPEHEIIHNIPDQAIDEIFPPDAMDAAELDAVDEFVHTLVDLSFLEDREEKLRNNFSFVKKRWESRREDGLKGKPHPARGLIVKKSFARGNASTKDTSIVKFSHQTDAFEKSLDNRLRTRNERKQSRLSGLNKAKGVHGYSQFIVQPRKYY
jgi:hypothetical protein